MFNHCCKTIRRCKNSFRQERHESVSKCSMCIYASQLGTPERVLEQDLHKHAVISISDPGERKEDEGWQD